MQASGVPLPRYCKTERDRARYKMAREHRHTNVAKREHGGWGKLKAPKHYTFAQSFKEQEHKPHEGEWQYEIHERAIDRKIEAWRNRGKNAAQMMNDADVAYFDKRLRLYDELRERLETYDPVKDYAARNIAMHKIACIRAEFDTMADYSKKHNANSYMCEKRE